MRIKHSSLLPIIFCSSTLLPLHAIAGETAQMHVKAVLTPGACSLSLGKTNTIDYGTLNQEDIAELTPNQAKNTLVELKAQKLPVAIKCTSDAQVALSLNSQLASDENAPQSGQQNWAGLNTNDGLELGAYSVTFKKDEWLIGNVKPDAIGTSLASKTDWSAQDSETLKLNDSEWVTWLDGKNQPLAGNTFAGFLNITAVLNKNKANTINADTPVKGDTTLTLHYI